MLQFDTRSIKDEAARESAKPGMNRTPSTKKTIRPFPRVVAIQIKKNHRDKNLRTRLQREKAQEQTKNDRQEDLLNQAMHPRKPLSNAHPNTQKQHRNKKSMSAFLSFMRPIHQSQLVVVGDTELKYVFRYLWDFQNHYHSDEEWVDHQRKTTCCQESENQSVIHPSLCDCVGGGLVFKELGLVADLLNGNQTIFKSSELTHFNLHFSSLRFSMVFTLIERQMHGQTPITLEMDGH